MDVAISLYPTTKGTTASDLTYPAFNFEHEIFSQRNLTARLINQGWDKSKRIFVSTNGLKNKMLYVDAGTALYQLENYIWQNPAVSPSKFTIYDCRNETIGYGEVFMEPQNATVVNTTLSIVTE